MMKKLTLLLSFLSILSLSLFAQEPAKSATKIEINKEPAKLELSESQHSFVIETKDTYMILEGEETSLDREVLQPEWIEAINVYKEKDQYPEPYRELSEYGLIVVQLKEKHRNDLPVAIRDRAQAKETEAYEKTIVGQKAPEGLRLGTTSDNPPTFVIELDDTYVVLEGSESSDEQVLEPDWIESIQVHKDQAQYPKPYQDLGEYGLIIVQLKQEHIKDLPQSVRDRAIKQE